jgi:hypothetical protein
MPDDREDREKTEKTPKGMTVSVPSRDAFFSNLKKAAKPDKGSTSGSGSAKK